MATASDLAWAYKVSDDDSRTFQRNGFIRLKDVLGSPTLDSLAARLPPLVPKERHRDDYGLAFRYRMHAWLDDEFVRHVTLSRRLAGIAADLLGVSALRLSHDHVMFKDAGDSKTPVHADQYHWPISSDQAVSLWIPLSAVAFDMGPLSFFAGSHKIDPDLRVQLEHCDQETALRILAPFPENLERYELGDVSFHYGWTFHRAGDNSTSTPRNAFGIVYVEDGTRIIEPRDGVPIEALSHWSPNAEIGAPLDSPRNPVVFRR